jgi:hypothetical protein
MLRRPAVACLVLLVVYVGLSFLNDDHGFLGTDTGAKVATLRAMERNGGLDPDLGYWAEQWDPGGRLHPLYRTLNIDGAWVNVSTLPALYAAYPLWRLGGYRAALLLPMLGTVLAALAASSIVRRLGGDGAAALWIVGLTSPLVLYALDFWEHSLGVAAIAWAVAHLLAALDDQRWWHGAVAGALFGLAATMRTEALVYGAVATAVACLVLLVQRRRWFAPLALGLSAAVCLAALVGAGTLLERSTVGSSLRTTRASGTVTQAITGNVDEAVPSRVREAGTTTFALQPSLEDSAIAIGVMLALLLAYAAARGRPGADPGPVRFALVAVVALYLMRFAEGLGFIPGLVAAAPLAVAGAVLGLQRGASRVVVVIALLSLPVVWAFQFRGGAIPQWGGRYVLPSALLLVCAAIAGMPRLRPEVRTALIGLSAVVTVFGVAWLADRSGHIGDTSRALARSDEPVLVSRIAHLVREIGADNGVEGDPVRWLTAVYDDDEQEAGRVLAAAGVDRFGLVEIFDAPAAPRRIGEFQRGAASAVEFFPGINLRVTEFARR